MAKQKNKSKKTVKQSPPASAIAGRTRSQKQKMDIAEIDIVEMDQSTENSHRKMDKQLEVVKKSSLKPKVKLRQCTVRLLKLSELQIMTMIGCNLANIETKNTPQYNLRKRPAQPIERIEPKTKVTSRAASALISPSDLTASSLWRFLKKGIPELSPNSLCLAKMKSYSPWPAILLSVTSKKSEVYFFGDGKKGTVDTSEVVPIERCAVLIKKFLHLRNYSRAVREMELTQNIPASMSIINR